MVKIHYEAKSRFIKKKKKQWRSTSSYSNSTSHYADFSLSMFVDRKKKKKKKGISSLAGKKEKIIGGGKLTWERSYTALNRLQKYFYK